MDSNNATKEWVLNIIDEVFIHNEMDKKNFYFICSLMDFYFFMYKHMYIHNMNKHMYIHFMGSLLNVKFAYFIPFI